MKLLWARMSHMYINAMLQPFSPSQVPGSLKMNNTGFAWRSKAGVQNVAVVKSDIVQASWGCVGTFYQLRVEVKGGVQYKFNGFEEKARTPVEVSHADRSHDDRNRNSL